MDMNLYTVAAMIMDRNPNVSAKALSEALNCAISTANSLRSLYFTCGGDPEMMREKSNEASRNSKRKMRTSMTQIALH